MFKKENAGNRNTGDCNTGNRNTGDCNTGDCNAGDCNAGHWNTGHWNTGHWNTGHCNAGNRNTGHWNTGHCNAGNRNTGDCNTGNWNTGHCNTGYCNSVTPEDCLIFNKPANRQDWIDAEKPNWMYSDLTKWIDEDDMSDSEKEAYPSYTTTGGYLKYFTSLKQAYIEAWEKANKKDRELTYKLPNYDREVFIEVFGFDPEKDSKKKVTLELTDAQLDQIKEIIE